MAKCITRAAPFGSILLVFSLLWLCPVMASAQVVVGGNDVERILTIQSSATYYPPQPEMAGIVPVSLLVRDYESWTKAQQRLVPRKQFEAFRAMEPDRNGFCSNADVNSQERPQTQEVFRAMLEREPVLLIGTIERSEPAWDFIAETARTILDLRVESVLKNGGYFSRTVVPGDLIYLIRRDGSFAYKDGAVCSVYPPKPQAALPIANLSTEPLVPGSRFLIAGNFGEHNQQFLQTVRQGRLLIHDDQILPAPGAWVDPAPKVTLQDIQFWIQTTPNQITP